MERLPTSPATPFTRWLAGFLADRATRTISAESLITVPEFQKRFPKLI